MGRIFWKLLVKASKLRKKFSGCLPNLYTELFQWEINRKKPTKCRKVTFSTEFERQKKKIYNLTHLRKHSRTILGKFLLYAISAIMPTFWGREQGINHQECLYRTNISKLYFRKIWTGHGETRKIKFHYLPSTDCEKFESPPMSV